MPRYHLHGKSVIVTGAPASAFRGIINILSDAVLERDREVLALVHRIDAEERQRRLSSIVS